MRGVDPALVYTAAELIVAALIMVAAVTWAHHVELQQKKRRDRMIKRGRDEK